MSGQTHLIYVTINKTFDKEGKMKINGLQLVTVSLLLATSCVGQTAPPLPVIDIETHFLLFDRQDIESITKDKFLVPVTALRALWKQGKCSNLYPPLKVSTIPGEETCVKAMIERIYPTEFSVVRVRDMITTNPSPRACGNFVQPSGFETREVGTIFAGTATLLDDAKSIQLKMSPQAVVELAPTKYKGVYINEGGQQTEVPLDQPTFKIFSFLTTVNVRDGDTTIAGSQNYGPDDKVLFVLVTAKIQPISNQTSRAIGTPGAPQPER